MCMKYEYSNWKHLQRLFELSARLHFGRGSALTERRFTVKINDPSSWFRFSWFCVRLLCDDNWPLFCSSFCLFKLGPRVRPHTHNDCYLYVYSFFLHCMLINTTCIFSASKNGITFKMKWIQCHFQFSILMVNGLTSNSAGLFNHHFFMFYTHTQNRRKHLSKLGIKH